MAGFDFVYLRGGVSLDKLIGGKWGDEKEVPLVLKVDPIFIPLQIYYFKNLSSSLKSFK
jgi:hypothetical protein